MKRFLLIPFFLFALGISDAQVSYSTITGTVTDANSHPLANAQLTATLVMTNGTPINGLATPNGQLFNGSPVRGTLDANGFFSIGLVPNAILSQPSGKPITTQWLIQIIAPQDSAILTYSPSWNLNYQFTVTGSVDLSSQLSALVTTPVAYFNTKTNQSTIQGTGGANPVGNQNSLQTKNGTNLGGGLGTLDPATGKLSASVNTQLNVMMYGAKGDCATDDQTAIQAALTASLTYAVSSTSGPAAVYFPKPPGGCYLTSTLDWVGQTLIGQPSGVNQYGPGVTIQGKPGQDIIHAHDPSLVANKPFYVAWQIKDLTLSVDDTVPTTGLFPHRFPGRWFHDASIASGSTSIFTTDGVVSCGDIGEPIQVNGAGISGANLVTTVASVFPCYGQYGYTVVNLAAAASTTVSGAYAYVSVNGKPVTYTLGNAAIAMDDHDGNSANWPTPISGAGGDYPRLENVWFKSVTGSGQGQNGSTAFFTQGAYGQYGLHVDFMNAQHLEWGIVQACSDLNPRYQSCAQDFQRWNHLDLYSSNPWVSYNGLHNHLNDVQLCSNSSMMFLSNKNVNFDNPDQLTIENLGQECATTAYGLRTTGLGAVFNTVDLSTSSEIAWIDGFGLTCTNCSWSGVELNGAHNRIRAGGQDESTASVINGGRDNAAILGYQSLPRFSLQAVSSVTGPSRNPNWIQGYTGPDAFQDGNSSVAYYNREDLLMWPTDAIFNATSAWSNYFNYDASSPSGSYLLFGPSSVGTVAYVNTGTNFPGGSSHIPFGNVTMTASLECVGGTTANLGLGDQTAGFIAGSTPLAITCSTTQYQTFTYRANVTSSSTSVGPRITVSGGTTGVKFAWSYIRPDIHDINGLQFAGAGPAIPTGPSSGTTAGHAVCYNDTNGTQVDCGTTPGGGSVASGGSYAIPAYPSTPAASVSPSNIQTDVTGNNLNVPGHVAIGSSPPTAACQNGGLDIHGCTAMSEGATAGTPTAGVDYWRADSTTHQLLFSLNGGAETAIVGIGNVQITTGTTAIPANTCTTNTATSMPGVTTTSAIVPPTPTSSTTAVVGWGASGGLSFSYYVTANTFNWSVCNLTAASITPGASVTWNIGAR